MPKLFLENAIFIKFHWPFPGNFREFSVENNSKIMTNNNLKAYKLYISENAIEENIVNQKYWPRGGDEFTGTARDINTLIQTALSLEFKFNNNSFKRGKTDYGKSLESHLKSIKLPCKNTEHLEDFAQLFGCYSFDIFKTDKTLTKIKDEFLDKVIQMKSEPEKEVIKYKFHTGFFLLYSCSSYRRGLVQYPIFIDNNGGVEIKTQEGVVKGKALGYYGDRFLILDFFTDYEDGQPFMGAFLVYVKNIGGGAGTGVSFRINTDLQAQSKREYLIWPDNKKKECTYADMLKEFENSEFEHFYPDSLIYEKLKGKYPKIDSLIGREYNLITETTHTSDPGKLFNREKFDKMYFHEALLEFLKTKEITPKAERYFILALEHGLFLEERFIHYLNEFCTILNLDKSLSNIIKNTFSSRYELFHQEYAHGSQ
jgi:hypothetical protein